MKTHDGRNHGFPLRSLALLVLGMLTANPLLARQADREGGRSAGDRYVGTRSMAATVIEWRADHVVESQTGPAGVYQPADHRRRTSSGERYDHSAMTAAHPSFPYDSMIRVTSLETGRRIVVRVNDRLDTGANEVIRLSESAADRLGMESGSGWADREVRIELLSSETVPAVTFRPRRVEESGQRRVTDDAHRDARNSDEAHSGPSSDPPRDVRSTALDRAARAGSDDAYTLQIGAFSTLDAARRLASDIEGAWVMQVLEHGERVYRVYFGQFDREQMARAAQERLKKKGRDSFLRTIPS